MPSADRPGTRLATRIAFFIAGFVVSCWAPLVPFAQARLGVDSGVLGLLLLCLGLGSVSAMLLTGTLSARYGSRPIILVGCAGLLCVTCRCCHSLPHRCSSAPRCSPSAASSVHSTSP